MDSGWKFSSLVCLGKILQAPRSDGLDTRSSSRIFYFLTIPGSCDIKMASKRRRDVSTADTRLIEIYEDLANENEEIRLKAAHTLLSEFARPTSSSQQKIKTILQRLFRGLCSSRKAARLGFSVALTEFLAQIFQSPVEERGLSQNDILGILDKDTISGGNTSGQVCTFVTVK
jgi:DNA polymerase phi